MWMALRHALAIAILPFTVVVLVPSWLLVAASDSRWSATPITWAPRVLGLLLMGAGFALFATCVGLFAWHGRGTLAPWDPTRSLVAVGPYRFVRNPMITGVLTMLAGEALWWGSWRVCAWALTFFVFNQIFFLVFEEPDLERRFGEPYRAYKASVPRWLPRRPRRG